MFSLEMSHVELTQRLLCSEARVDSRRIRTGQLTDDDWKRISRAVGRLGEAELWIDDNPNLTIMELRAKARRLKSQLGDLGLIVVDYLQLMSGRANAENRQVEVAEISRGLKILAREVEAMLVREGFGCEGFLAAPVRMDESCTKWCPSCFQADCRTSRGVIG